MPRKRVWWIIILIIGAVLGAGAFWFFIQRGFETTMLEGTLACTTQDLLLELEKEFTIARVAWAIFTDKCISIFAGTRVRLLERDWDKRLAKIQWHNRILWVRGETL